MDEKKYKEELSLEANYVKLAMDNLGVLNAGIGRITENLLRLALEVDVRSTLEEVRDSQIELEALVNLMRGRAEYIRTVWDEHDFDNR